MSLLNRLLGVLCAFMCLCAHVFGVFACLRAYVLVRLHAYVLTCLHACVLGVFACLGAWRACVFAYLRACMLGVFTCLTC